MQSYDYEVYINCFAVRNEYRFIEMTITYSTRILNKFNNTEKSVTLYLA